MMRKQTTKIKVMDDMESPYHSKINAEMADKLYCRILEKIVSEKKYKDPEYSAKQLQKDLNTNSRYISAVFHVRFGCNYNQFLNSYRIRDAKKLLTNKRYNKYTVEEIGLMVGFNNRQCFYLAFGSMVGTTPRQYRVTGGSAGKTKE